MESTVTTEEKIIHWLELIKESMNECVNQVANTIDAMQYKTARYQKYLEELPTLDVNILYKTNPKIKKLIEEIKEIDAKL